MGQAKQRGSFEDRKEQAIAEGREKREKLNIDLSFSQFDAVSIIGSVLARRARSKKILIKD